MPTMSSIVVPLTNEEKIINNERITAAPASAPARILMYPPIVLPNNVPNSPPKASITTATPRLAPVETPRIDGPASGLLNVVCINSPDTASAAPASTAVTAIGTRDCNIINSHASFELPFPERMLMTSSIGIFTEPTTRLATKSTISNNTNKIIATRLLRYVCVSSFIGQWCKIFQIAR